MSQNTTAMQRGAGGETTGATDMTTQQPEALRLAEILEGGYSLAWLYERGGYEVSAELRRQHARITALEAQLEAVGAGGVGPLIASAGFDAADMATASAQGFRGGAASLSANAVEPRNALDRDALIDAIAQGLHGTWHCTRVWEAWHVGTMSQDDFEPVDESETPTEIADAVLALLAAPPAAQAVVDRWDTPLWKDVPATAEYIGRLRAALAAGQATAARQPHRSGCTAGSDEECVQRGCGTNCPAVSPQADSVQEDAARYRWLAASCRSTSEHWGGRWSIIIDGPAPKSHDSEDDFDAAVDAARKQGATQ